MNFNLEITNIDKMHIRCHMIWNAEIVFLGGVATNYSMLPLFDFFITSSHFSYYFDVLK
jgi:hypothetical protein